MELTLREKVNQLKKANPKISDSEACILLGIRKEDLEKDRKQKDNDLVNEMFGNIFGGKRT